MIILLHFLAEHNKLVSQQLTGVASNVCGCCVSVCSCEFFCTFSAVLFHQKFLLIFVLSIFVMSIMILFEVCALFECLRISKEFVICFHRGYRIL